MGFDQQERQRRDDLLAKQDARNEELFGEQMDAVRDARQQRQNQQAIDQAIADSGKAGQINDNAATVNYTNQNGQQRSAYQPDMGTAQFAAQQQANEAGYPTDFPATPQPATVSNPTADQANQGNDQTNQGNDSDSSQPAPASAAPTAAQLAGNPTAAPAIAVRDLTGNQKLFTGLNAASDAKAFSDQNQPGSYAQFMALRTKLSGMLGGQKAADEYLARAKEAQKEGIYETMMQLDSDNPSASKAKNIFNSTGAMKLDDNENFAPEIGADGKPTGNWQIVKTDANGNQNVIVPNFKAFAQQRILGVKGVEAAYQNQLATQSRIAEEQGKGVVVPMGGTFIPGKGDTRQPVVNENNLVPAVDAQGNPIYDSNGQPAMVKPIRGGANGVNTGTGAAAAGKVPDAIKEALKGNEAGIATATELASAFHANNPGMPVDQANGLGIRASSGANRRAVFNPSTGMFDEYFDDKLQLDKDGKPTGFATGKSYLVQSHQYADNGAIPPAEAQKAVAQMQQQLPAAQFNSYVAASSPDAYKTYTQNANAAFTSIVDKAKQDIAAVNSDTTLNPQQKAEKLQTIQNAVASQQQSMYSDLRRLDLVRQFYKAPATPGNASQGAAAAQPTIAQRLQTPGGLGSAVPRDAAEKAAAAEADVQRRSDADKAAKAAQVAADNQAKADIAGLTPAVIKNISDLGQARDLYNKYNMQLNAFQREAFQMQIDKLRIQQSQQADLQRYKTR
jgi:hypothetical protein